MSNTPSDLKYTKSHEWVRDNGDGTVTDTITGLMWQQSPDTDGDDAPPPNQLHIVTGPFEQSFPVADLATIDQIVELLDDLGQIARVDFELDDPNEEDQVAFEELVEYIRVGTLLIHEELQPAVPPQRLS